MLIRSQNKKMIFDMSGCTLGMNLENEICGFGNNSPIEDPPTILGYYKTKERAIEVLDEICNYYKSNYNGVLDEICNYYKSNYNGVFQMPEV